MARKPKVKSVKPVSKRGVGRPQLEDTTDSGISGDDFTAWIESTGMSDSAIARRLGLGRSTVSDMKRKGGGAWLALACSALSAGLPHWKPGRKQVAS
jgi:hypothetical protein